MADPSKLTINLSQVCLGCMSARSPGDTCPACGWAYSAGPESPLYLPPGAKLYGGRYIVGRLLGHGGFGITYLGWDINLARKIAIKEFFPTGVAIRTSGAPDVFPYSNAAKPAYEWGLDRYLSEARLLARFENHPNIVWVKDYFPENGTAYMVLEFLDGMTLDHYVRDQGGRIPWDVTLQIIAPVMDALREVHRFGILHRDVSPDNIYLLRSGSVKVIDFGAARNALGERSQNLSVILKQGYAPPEQYQTKGNQGPWTDVYAVAGTLYRVLSGELPQPAPDRLAQDAMAGPRALGADIPAEKEAVLLKAMSLRKEERYQDMGAFQEALLEGTEFAPSALQGPRTVHTMGRGFTLGAGVSLAPASALSQPPAVASDKPAPVTLGPTEVLETTSPGVIPLPVPPPVTPSPVAPTVAMPPPAAAAPPVAVTPPPPPFSAAPEPPAQSRTGLWLAIAVLLLLLGGGAGYFFLNRGSAPKIDAFTAERAAVSPGQSTTLRWAVSNAKEVTLEPGLGSRAANGEISVSPAAPTTYTLTALGDKGERVEARVRVEVSGQGKPRASTPPPSTDAPNTNPGDPPPAETSGDAAGPIEVASFTGDPATITAGQSAQLAWTVKGAAQLKIEPEIGTVSAQGAIAVQPKATTRYTLTATDSAGKTFTATATITVGADAGSNPAAALSWKVIHDHEGMIDLDRSRKGCEGTMSVEGKRVRFASDNAAHSFDVPYSQIAEVKGNRLRRGFHIKLSGGKNFNFNAVSESVNKIVDAINAAGK